jgi:hypothetical protein
MSNEDSREDPFLVRMPSWGKSEKGGRKRTSRKNKSKSRKNKGKTRKIRRLIKNNTKKR